MRSNIHYESGYKYEIFIGMKDQDKNEELINVEDFTAILEKICAEKEISFSLLKQVGGYAHSQGYATETSLRIIVIGVDEEEVFKLGEELKVKVNTDQILITKIKIDYAYIK